MMANDRDEPNGICGDDSCDEKKRLSSNVE